MHPEFHAKMMGEMRHLIDFRAFSRCGPLESHYLSNVDQTGGVIPANNYSTSERDMSDDDEPPATLKKGGGRGRGGGFGYVFQQQFAKPFEKALKITMKSYSPPANNIFGAALTTQILTMLKTTFSDLSRPVYDSDHDVPVPDPKNTTNLKCDLKPIVQMYCQSSHLASTL
jgi:hypothetical protein